MIAAKDTNDCIKKRKHEHEIIMPIIYMSSCSATFGGNLLSNYG